MGTRDRADRLVETFHEGPASVRGAIKLIVMATIATTIIGGILVRIFDHADFRNLGAAMWWSLQTVTTVGYGDITPKNWIGRIVGSAVLLYSVAFMAILTAAITTSFIERARGERKAAESAENAVVTRLDDIAARLDRLERSLSPGDGAGERRSP